MILIKKSLLKSLVKKLENHKLESLKKEVLDILNKKAKLENQNVQKSLNEIEKALKQVGETSTYKDGSVWKKIQMTPPKWKCIKQGREFATENKGSKIAIAALIKKVEKCQTVNELYDVVFHNISRFRDENGNILPIVEKVKNAVNSKKTMLNTGKPTTQEQIDKWTKEHAPKITKEKKVKKSPERKQFNKLVQEVVKEFTSFGFFESVRKTNYVIKVRKEVENYEDSKIAEVINMVNENIKNNEESYEKQISNLVSDEKLTTFFSNNSSNAAKYEIRRSLRNWIEKKIDEETLKNLKQMRILLKELKAEQKERQYVKNNLLIEDYNENDIVKGSENFDESKLKTSLNVNLVPHFEVNKLSSKLSDEEIIKKVSGGDKTKGSCVSLAMAFVANKAGFDVLDFRGGSSQYVFSRNVLNLTKLNGVNVFKSLKRDETLSAEDVLKKAQKNKLYLLSTGRHMAVIRKTDDKLEYLELQSNVTNGFKNLTKRTLKDRFKCKGNNGKYASPSHLIDVESLLTNNNFEKVLPYINTLSDRQLKGVEGGEK